GARVAPDQWFTLELILQGNRAVILVNDQLATDYLDVKRLFTSGHIALQQNNPQTVIEFRKIEIRELNHPAQTNGLPSGTPGWVSLFNGKDLTGWKTHPSQPGNWRVEDGILIGGTSPTGSHLYSDRDDFHDDHLRVEARFNASGRGGVYLRSTFGPRF